jgi:hypothetical protein
MDLDGPMLVLALREWLPYIPKLHVQWTLVETHVASVHSFLVCEFLNIFIYEC